MEYEFFVYLYKFQAKDYDKFVCITLNNYMNNWENQYCQTIISEIYNRIICRCTISAPTTIVYDHKNLYISPNKTNIN